MADVKLDVCGEVCPMPVVKTKKALENMEPGQVLEVIIDYPPAKENVKRFAINHGHEVIDVVEEGGNFKILIKKGE